MNGDPNALDPASLAPYLEANVPGFEGLDGIEKFNAGQSNPTYMLKARSGRYVLRAKPTGQLLKSAHQVDREYRVMRALRTTGFPVPEMLHLSGEDSPIGRMFYVMRFVEGRILWDPALPEAYVEAYCRRRGIDDIGDWTFYLAFSFFRLAAICQGVYKRSLDGNASNPEKARTYGEAVKLLAALAMSRINEGE